jgi:hypothetical protein
MEKPLYEKRGAARWGMNVIFNSNITQGAAAFGAGKISVFKDRIDFQELSRIKTLLLIDLDYVGIRSPVSLWFFHHSKKAPKFLAFRNGKNDIDELITVLKSLNIQIQKSSGFKLTSYINKK